MNTEEVEWVDLASLAEHYDLTPVHSMATGRTWVTLEDGTVVWANTAGMTLDPAVEGSARLAMARLYGWGAQVDAEREARLAAMTPTERAAELKREAQPIPDPPDWLTDAYRERHPY